MTDKPATDKPANASQAAPTEGETAQAAGPAPPAEAAEAAVDPVAALTKECAELKDKLLRALAEMENLRRRTEREVADARQYGIAGFARDVLVVADNMRRALDAISADLRASGDPNIKSLIEGVELTERELLKTLEKHGVRRFDPQGQKFDPNLHQAMFEVVDSAAAPGTVVQVIQAGYMIGDRILRPALVGVAKAPPKPAVAETAAEAPPAAPEQPPANDPNTP